ncbi:MAG: hypothetical protein ACI8W8_002112, partial [Rhodothermales bacterium]
RIEQIQDIGEDEKETFALAAHPHQVGVCQQGIEPILRRSHPTCRQNVALPDRDGRGICEKLLEAIAELTGPAKPLLLRDEPCQLRTPQRPDVCALALSPQQALKVFENADAAVGQADDIFGEWPLRKTVGMNRAVESQHVGDRGGGRRELG